MSATYVITENPDELKSESSSDNEIYLENRPAYLQSLLPVGALRDRFDSCDTSDVLRQAFSIAHRGAPLGLPEHTEQGYVEAARQGAGSIECDVTFTADRELVCRHSQCDLHTTTDILATPLAESCRVPPDFESATPFANVECCTADLTLAEFQSLRGKRDGGDSTASTVASYLAGTDGWSGDVSVDYATLMTHSESVQLFDSLGVNMIPELKSAQVPLPFDGEYTREDFTQQLLDEYRAANIDPERVRIQSFELDDIRWLSRNAPEFADGLVYLDGRYRRFGFDVDDPASWVPSMAELSVAGVAFLAPPIWMLVELNSIGDIVPSAYATAASDAGLRLLAWSLERGVDATAGGGWYYQSVADVFDDEGDQLVVLDVLANEVGVEGVFSDWPATTTSFAHCALDR